MREDVGHAYGAVLPVIPGYDVAGEVVAVGEGVADVAPGMRVYVHYDFSCGRCPYCLEGDEAACAEYGVMGVNRDGGYAEQIAAPVRNLFALPDGLSYETAAAAGSVYLTAYHMLFSRAGSAPRRDRARDRGRLGRGRGGDRARPVRRRPGDRDGVDRGQARAGARRPESSTPSTTPVPGWGAEVRRLTGGRGVDLVVDHVGAAAVPEALAALANKGRIVLCGASSGPRVELDLIDLFARQISLIGSSDGSRRELWEVLRLLGEGLIDPPAIEAVLPLEEAAKAQELLGHGRTTGGCCSRPRRACRGAGAERVGSNTTEC